VFRDLKLLKLAGLPVEFDEASGRYRLRGNTVLPPLNFTATEALALLVLCHQSSDRCGAPFQRAAAGAAVKLESNLPGRLRDELYGVADAVSLAPRPRALQPGDEATYLALLHAAGQRRCVRLRYDSLSEGQIGTKLSPYRLFFSRHAWYVIGRSSLHREVRTFHLGRILRLEPLEEPFHVPRGFSLDRYLRNAWHLIPERGRDRRVHLRFAPLVARNVADVLWHKTQRTRFNPDGTLDYRVTVSGLWEISWWILGYGDQVEVLRPKELREIVAQRLRGALKRYGAERARAKSTRRTSRG
jgi:proteasome accessory factor B